MVRIIAPCEPRGGSGQLRPILSAIIALLACGAPGGASAKPAAVSVAAAANLIYAVDALNAAFSRSEPEVDVTVSTGASGSLFAQIRHGAPFDVFLSADVEYPREVVAAGAGDARTLRVFATGQLVVWTTRAEVDLADLPRAMRSSAVRKIALAQPKTAPYGRAAQAALEALSVWQAVRPKLVMGESISQTAQFVETTNADLGFVALSLVLSPRLAGKGRWVEVPRELYAPVSLDHAVVLTTSGAANPAAQRYLKFLGSEPAKKILREFGYR